jgi:competence protein ComEC
MERKVEELHSVEHFAPNPPQRTPLLWLLAGLLVGYPLGHYFLPRSLEAVLLLVSAIVLAVASWRFGGDKSAISSPHRWAWAVCFLAATIAASSVYYSLRQNTAPEEWKELPPRELTLDVRVERMFAPLETYTTQGGLGSILGSELHPEDLVGQRVFFNLRREALPEIIPRGTVWRITGVLSPLDPSGSEFYEYLNLQEVTFAFRHGRLREILHPGSPAARFFAHTRQKLEANLRFGAEGSLSSLGATFAAILTGNRALLTEEQKNLFLLTGTMHLFAVSGLHVMAIAAALYYVLLLFRLPTRYIPLLSLPLLFLYVQVTGAPASAVRAFSMVLFHHLALLGARRPAPLPALAASAVVVLILWPQEIWSAGFRLSYAVVFAIVAFGLPLAQFLTEKAAPPIKRSEKSFPLLHTAGRKAIDFFLNLSAIGLAAGLASIPLSVEYFNIVAPGGLFINLALMPLAGLTVVNGVVSAAVGFLQWESGLLFCNRGAWVLISAMEGIVEAFATKQQLFFYGKFVVSGFYLGVLAGFAFLVSWLHAPPVRSPAKLGWRLLCCALWCIGTTALGLELIQKA